MDGRLSAVVPRKLVTCVSVVDSHFVEDVEDALLVQMSAVHIDIPTTGLTQFVAADTMKSRAHIDTLFLSVQKWSRCGGFGSSFPPADQLMNTRTSIHGHESPRLWSYSDSCTTISVAAVVGPPHYLEYLGTRTVSTVQYLRTQV